MTRLIALLGFVALVGCQSVEVADQTSVANPQERISELQIVDCLLPGQMRMLGNSPYLTPRRPTRTTASDCRIRGGEFVAYDRADYKTALAVWMPQAEAGDAEAQANVGEIFERGLGSEPNYAAAKIWYEKAARQGNRKAQFNLGTLYEQGLGVEKNMIEALDWYRQAWDLPADELLFKSVVDEQLNKERAVMEAQKEKLDQDLAKSAGHIQILERQIQSLQTEAGVRESISGTMAEEIRQLNELVADLKASQADIQQESQTLAVRLRQPERPVPIPTTISAEPEPAPSNGSFGRYFALVISNERYNNLEHLETPNNDGDRVSEVLRSKYGFQVIRLRDSSNIAIMDAINNLNEILTEKDNLLIYYAGHGNRKQTGEFESGYWLPVNADAPPRDTLWIPNEFVTRHIARLSALRVLVVADSCYAGMLSSAPGFLTVNTVRDQSDPFIQYKKSRRARLLLTSGGDQPVLDNGGDGNSVFARAFIDALENNEGLLTVPEMFASVRARVERDSKMTGFEQKPEYKVIKAAGHEMGDFFFVPRNLEKS